MSAILALNIGQNILVHLRNFVRGEHLNDDVPLASLCPHSQVDNLGCIDVVCSNVSLHLDWLVGVEFVDIDLARLFELLLQLFSDGDDLAVLQHLLWELIQELFLRHWVQTVQVRQLPEFRILSQLVVISLINHVHRLERHSIRILFLQIIREVAIKDVRQHRL